MFGFDSDMIFRIPALLIALTIHEYAHARVAVSFGDPTPRILGRLTLNPLAHLDPIGLIMLWIFRFGWAKPVPVNPNNFTNHKNGMMGVSLAGPLANILVAFTVAVLFAVLVKLDLLNNFTAKILSFTYMYNVIFAIFNLIPLPPLDGSKVLMALLPGRQSDWFERIEPYAPFILMGLIYIGAIGVIINPLERGLSFIIQGIVSILI